MTTTTNDDIPHAVLSEEFAKHVDGQRVLAAVFLTFCFEPAFFEQEVLPALLDFPESLVAKIRLVQLETRLRNGIGPIAVYYDRRGLVAGTESAKLEFERIPIEHRRGYFHPKNVLLLVEPMKVADAVVPVRKLIVAAMSANLTRAGWWENVEVCHVESVAEGEMCGFRDDLRGLLRRVRDISPPNTKHEALDQVRAFVRGLTQRKKMTSDGALFTRLYAGGEALADFLEANLIKETNRLCLEVISPYFDDKDAAPLRKLCQRLRPRQVRVFLPRNDDGSSPCNEAFFDAVKDLPNVKWGRLPADVVRTSTKDNKAKRRTVHAKVYRFFDENRRYEALLVGSLNLTSAAHTGKANVEAGFLVEPSLLTVPTWWMEPDLRRPEKFVEPEPAESKFPLTHLMLRYDWHRGIAEAFWDSNRAAKGIAISAQGVPLFEIDSLGVGKWIRLPEEAATVLQSHLRRSSFVCVADGEAEPVTILVQEDGMEDKPSLLLDLSPEDILKYWSLLSVEQQNAFIEAHAESLSDDVLAEAGLVRPVVMVDKDSMFAAFAGVYHGFESLRAFVHNALENDRDKDATHRLFGQKYDSLPVLVDRVIERADKDVVRAYVTLLCAQQLLREVRERWPDYASTNRERVRSLEKQLTAIAEVRDRLSLRAPLERGPFLDWFEQWFLKRAVELEASA